MEVSLIVETDAWVIAIILFIAMMIALWAGKTVGGLVRKKSATGEKLTEIAGFSGLLFFLLAFTFAMSGTRYDTRRFVVIEEANNIGTAILRSDLYGNEERVLFRKDFKAYVEARIAFYEAGINLRAVKTADSLSQVISARLWERAARLSRDPANMLASQQMIPALNTVIDVVSTRMYAEKEKVPESILIMLFFLSCITAFFGGYSAGRSGKSDWLTEVGFCVLISLVILFTVDLDRPRRGFVNLDTPNQNIIDLRRSFNDE